MERNLEDGRRGGEEPKESLERLSSSPSFFLIHVYVSAPHPSPIWNPSQEIQKEKKGKEKDAQKHVPYVLLS